jgi:ribosomal protein S21
MTTKTALRVCATQNQDSALNALKTRTARILIFLNARTRNAFTSRKTARKGKNARLTWFAMKPQDYVLNV